MMTHVTLLSWLFLLHQVVARSSVSPSSALAQAQAFRFGTLTVPQNLSHAMDLYREIGTPEASFALGEIYYYREHHQADSGLNMFEDVDIRQSLVYFEQSASGGFAPAQHMLGVIYSSIASSSKDMAQSVLNFYFAALGGSLEANLALGYRHKMGLHVPQSCTTALRYYKYAADHAISSAPELYLALPPAGHSLESEAEARDVETQEALQLVYFQSSGNSHMVLYKIAKLLMRSMAGDHEFVDWSSTKAILDTLAQSQGIALAQAYLGHMYAYGLGNVERNLTRAATYYHQAADQGNDEAQNGLGLLYLHGRGVTLDHDVAIDYFMLASRQGHPDAVYHVGEMYAQRAQLAKALEHFLAAANVGHVRAIFELGRRLEHGRGFRSSCSLALQYYKQVAELSLANEAQYRHARRALESGRPTMALKRYMKLAEEGHVDAQVNVAKLIEKQHQRAFKVTKHQHPVVIRQYQRAAEQGHVGARVVLGDHYYYHDEYTQALAHYRITAKRQDPQSLYNLGYLYEHGQGVRQDCTKAREFYDQVLQVDRHAHIPIQLTKWRMSFWTQGCGVYPGGTLQSIWNGVVEFFRWDSSETQTKENAGNAETQTMEIEPREGKASSGLGLGEKPLTRSWTTPSSSPPPALGETQTSLVFRHGVSATVESSMELSGETFTLETWLYLDPDFRGSGNVVSRVNSFGLAIVSGHGGQYVHGLYFPNRRGLLSKTPLEKGKWTHVALVKHEAYFAIYINGKMDNVRKYSGEIPQYPNQLVYVGAWHDGSAGFRGKIASLRIWQVAKTPPQIRALMVEKPQARGNASPDLVFWWNFDTRSEPFVAIQTQIQDSSPYRHTITVYNRPESEQVLRSVLTGLDEREEQTHVGRN